MNDDDIENQEKQKDEKQIPETYDVSGMLIGGGVGVLVSFTGITDLLMCIVVGMFLGLLIGTYIKK